MRQVVLDTETTGLNPKAGHRIIEIGCVEMIDRQLTHNNLHLYINPDREIDAGAMKVHGITNQFLDDKLRFREIVDEFIQFIKGAELIIHNAPFDIGFLDHELHLCGNAYGAVSDYSTVLDTLVLARKKHAGQRNTLDALCQRYYIDNSNRQLHGALLDSELLAQVYLLMTGGQAQLFKESAGETSLPVGEDVAGQLIADCPALPVIEPSSDELRAHQNYLSMLKEKGDCVWRDD